MSDPHIVLVTVDFAPHDSDSESEPFVFEFSGPENASAFYDQALSLLEREVEPQDTLVSVYEPLATTRFGTADDALMSFRDIVVDSIT
jgi:hypothetical protein